MSKKGWWSDNGPKQVLWTMQLHRNRIRRRFGEWWWKPIYQDEPAQHQYLEYNRRKENDCVIVYVWLWLYVNVNLKGNLTRENIFIERGIQFSKSIRNIWNCFHLSNKQSKTLMNNTDFKNQDSKLQEVNN